MQPIADLAALGKRIMICGPSNAGKSTLAVALGARLGVPAIHLDQYRHLPNTDYVQRPDAEFLALHDAAIQGDGWIIDGNYSSMFPQRFARATGIILISDNRYAIFLRYLRRTLFERQRAGALEGNRDSLKWDMVRWVLVQSPRNLRRYQQDLPKVGLPYVEARSMRDVQALYRQWGLERPKS